jgi:hypothetical protein
MHDSANLKSAVGHFSDQLDVPDTGSASQCVGISLRSGVIRSSDRNREINHRGPAVMTERHYSDGAARYELTEQDLAIATLVGRYIEGRGRAPRRASKTTLPAMPRCTPSAGPASVDGLAPPLRRGQGAPHHCRGDLARRVRATDPGIGVVDRCDPARETLPLDEGSRPLDLG